MHKGLICGSVGHGIRHSTTASELGSPIFPMLKGSGLDILHISGTSFRCQAASDSRYSGEVLGKSVFTQTAPHGLQCVTLWALPDRPELSFGVFRASAKHNLRLYYSKTPPRRISADGDLGLQMCLCVSAQGCCGRMRRCVRWAEGGRQTR